eukprot:CAMPEP_0195601096 /NCGR_PEP_ID=MMETSP0815-20121206/4902_1 /TAXON_ID=97485 /ORGANISM="Prymnesium parvum, Strain Texoma1" /LENGTH=112 /DNA_ID=CAMNT_0040740613 /DNA_START=287 /DNA_END=622 /DNA_ORIENTATION=+
MSFVSISKHKGVGGARSAGSAVALATSPTCAFFVHAHAQPARGESTAVPPGHAKAPIAQVFARLCGLPPVRWRREAERRRRQGLTPAAAAGCPAAWRSAAATARRSFWAPRH